jgi:arginyl-tRNA synthetase
MEDEDEEAMAFWRRVRDVNIESYTNLYARLNVSFDEYSGESQVSPSTMAEVEEILKKKGLCEESEEAWYVPQSHFYYSCTLGCCPITRRVFRHHFIGE